MRKALAMVAAIIGMIVLEGWVWTHTYDPLLPAAIIALAGVGALSLIWNYRIFRWAGICAAWAFYFPVLLALFQVSIGMAMIYGGLVAFFYGIWVPLLSSETTVWLVRGRISGLCTLQVLAPVLILVGLGLLLVGLAQVVRSKLRKTGFAEGGLYSLVRHPQYLGVNILTLGFVLYGLRPIDFIAWANLVILHMVLAWREEGKLLEKFGEEYLEYKRRVPFILPFIPYRLRRRFRVLVPPGWKRKGFLVGIYLLTMAVMLILVWIAWVASGGSLMR